MIQLTPGRRTRRRLRASVPAPVFAPVLALVLMLATALSAAPARAQDLGDDWEKADCSYKGGVYRDGYCEYPEETSSSGGGDDNGFGEALQNLFKAWEKGEAGKRAEPDARPSAAPGAKASRQAAAGAGAERWSALLQVGKPVSGYARSRGGQGWPFVYALSYQSPESGTIVGTIEWTTLGSVHKVDGRYDATGLSFTETAVIVPGQAILNCTYHFTALTAREVAGTWRCANGDSGEVVARR